MKQQNISFLNSYNPWLTIELTNLCNYNCIMCYREEVDIKQKGFISIRLFREIIKDIIQSGLKFYGLKLAWLGEAFMHPGISEILEILKKNNEFFKHIAFDTNISFIEKQHIQQLNDLNRPVFLFLSIDADSQQTYSIIRKNGDYNHIIRKIEIIKKYRNNNIFLRYQFIPMKQNIHEFKGFLEIFKQNSENIKVLAEEITDLKEDYIFIRKLVYPGSEQESTQTYIKAQNIAGIKQNIKEEQNNSETIHETICHKLYTMPIIRWNGVVGFCNNDPEMSLSPGRITDKLKFSQIWIQKMQKIRQDQQNRIYHGKCRECFEGVGF